MSHVEEKKTEKLLGHPEKTESEVDLKLQRKTHLDSGIPVKLKADSGETHMEKEPLLPYVRTQKKESSPTPITSLFPLPEHDEISVPPHPLTPSELKDRLIFGTPNEPPSSSGSFVDALNLAINTASPSSAEAGSISSHKTPHQSWLVDPNYPQHRTNLHRSKTAPAMAVINDTKQPSSGGKPPQFSSYSIVQQAVALLFLYLSLGVVIYWFCQDHFMAIETHPVVDGLYFCIVTMCTIGYGDITPESTPAKLFSILFVLVGFGFIDILLSAMVSYVLDLQESYLLRSSKVGREHDGRSYIIDFKKGRMRIRMKVGLALGVVVLCIGVGMTVMHFIERLGWVDSFYLSVMSVTTVGYGDRAFSSMFGRMFASIWLLVSTLAVARAFLYLAEARVDKRHRIMAKQVLGQDLTIAQFLAADMDNNGFVSKSEYVIYKLKELGKVSEKDIMQISQKFDRIDTGNCGKISLVDLMDKRH